MHDKSLVLARKRLRKPPNPAFPFVKCKTYRFLWTKIFSLLVRIVLQVCSGRTMPNTNAWKQVLTRKRSRKPPSLLHFHLLLFVASVPLLCRILGRIFRPLRCFHCFSKLPRDQRHRCDTPNIVRNIISLYFWVLWIQIQVCIFSSLWAVTNSTHFHKTSVSAFC